MIVIFVLPHIVSHLILLKRLAVLRACPETPRNVETSDTIVDVKIVEGTPSIVVADVSPFDKRESLSLPFLQIDTYYGFGRGGIASARIAHHLHALDLVGGESG